MKKLFFIFLTAAIFINTCGYVFIYWNLKSVYKKNMFSKLDSGELNHLLEEIVVSKNEAGTEKITRVEKREIKYKGKMYDIVREYELNNEIHFICISDENEDRINNFFEESYENNTDTKAAKNPLKNIFKLAIPFAVLNESYDLINYSYPRKYMAGEIVNPIHFYFEILTPPPQIFMS